MTTAKQGVRSAAALHRIIHVLFMSHVSVCQCFHTPGATSVECSFLFVQEGNNEANMTYFLLPQSKTL